MAGLCAAPDPDLGLVQGLLGSVDCNVQVLAHAGYGALSRPGSPVAAALIILLTVYIAVMGLRLMLGLASLRVGELTMTGLKIGVILALATNWPTYQQLVFDTLVQGPEQLGTTILRGLQPPDGSLAANPFAGLQSAYDELQRSALFYSQHAPAQVSPLQGGSGFAAMGLNLSAMLLLLNTVGALLAAKIVLALLLALGPVFVAMLLFDATRGLFEGWLRAAVGFAFVPLLSILGLVVQLTLLEPQLSQLADLRAENMMDPGVASAVFLLSLIFTMVTAALMIAVGVIAFGFRMPSPRRQAASSTAIVPASVATAPLPASQAQIALASRPERAVQIAMAAAALDRRESRGADGGAARSHLTLAAAGAGTSQIETSQGRGPGQSQRRSAQPRRAASTQRRDR